MSGFFLFNNVIFLYLCGMERKKKICASCHKECYIYARKMCLSCDRSANPDKHGLKPQETLKSKGNTNVPVKKKSSYISPISVKQKERLKEYRLVRDSFLKANPVCEFSGCTSTEVSLHHGAGRSGDLLTNTDYFVSLCFKHHRFVEENPTKAKSMGLSYDRLNKR